MLPFINDGLKTWEAPLEAVGYQIETSRQLAPCLAQCSDVEFSFIHNTSDSIQVVLTSNEAGGPFDKWVRC